MANPRAYTAYPPEYAEVFLRAAKAPVNITFPSSVEAKRFRFKLYAFRTAALDAPELSRKIALLAPMASLTLHENTLTIEYPKRNLEPLKEALDAAGT